MSPFDNYGYATLTGWNFAWKDEQGGRHYLVPPSELQMEYAYYDFSQDPAGIGQEATLPGRHQFLRLEPVPTPFRPPGVIAYTLGSPASVDVAMYDAGGRMIRKLESGSRDAGLHRLRWDGTADEPRPVASGVYWIVTRSREARVTKRMVVIK